MMGMTVYELYDMIPIHFWNKLSGFFELERMRERQHWERSRWETCLLLNIQIPKGKRLKPKDLLEFEDEKKGKEVDFEKLKAKAEFIKRQVEDNGK